MNDDPRMPRDHPEAELASYLDGSATGEERRLVDAHLVECASCRADLGFAARGRAAMQALPQLDSPGLAMPELERLHPDGQQATTPMSRAGRNWVGRRAERCPSQVPVWQRWAWGAGIAAAASLAAVFLFSSLNGGSKQATSLAGGAQDRRAESAIRSSIDYDRTSLDALARSLAQRTQAALKAGTTAESGKAPQFSPAAAPLAVPSAGGATSATSARLDQATATQALDCLRRGAGLPATATASYLEAASFGGTPAFIGAFPNGPAGGSPTQLQVIAVDRASCQALYVVTLPL